MEQAVAQGADVCVLPENFSFMAADGDKLQAAEDFETSESAGFLSSFARQHRVTLVGGSIPLRSSDPAKVSNSCLVYGPDGVLVARYDKMHLFDIALNDEVNFKESDYIRAGEAGVLTEIAGVQAGLTICYDLRFPELFRSYSNAGAQLIFVPAAFTVPTGQAHWEILLRARAIENQCFVVASGQWGRHSESRESYGHSILIDPWGQILASCPEGEGIAIADLDFAQLESVRRKLPALEHRILP